MKPICVPCQRFFRVKHNGYYFIEAMPKGDSRDPLPGTVDAASWEPYKLWVGDLWACEGCGAQIVSGVASRPIAEHYQPEFADKICLSQLQVNDC